MARHLKRGMDASAIKAADAKVRETVEHILADVEAGGDAAADCLVGRVAPHAHHEDPGSCGVALTERQHPTQ